MKASLATRLDRAMAASDPSGMRTTRPGPDPRRSGGRGHRVGLERITVEQVVRTAGLGWKTVYRRYLAATTWSKRSLCAEGERFLAEVAAGAGGRSRI